MKLLDEKTLSQQFINEVKKEALSLDGTPYLTVVMILLVIFTLKIKRELVKEQTFN